MSRARDGCDLLTAMQIDIVLRIRTLHSKRRDAEIHVTNVCTLRYIVRHVPNCSRRIDSPYIISISYQLSAGNEPNFAPLLQQWIREILFRPINIHSNRDDEIWMRLENENNVSFFSFRIYLKIFSLCRAHNTTLKHVNVFRAVPPPKKVHCAGKRIGVVDR